MTSSWDDENDSWCRWSLDGHASEEGTELTHVLCEFHGECYLQIESPKQVVNSVPRESVWSFLAIQGSSGPGSRASPLKDFTRVGLPGVGRASLPSQGTGGPHTFEPAGNPLGTC